MNRKIAKAGALLVTVSVVIFAAVMPFSGFLSYLVCMVLPVGYIMMTAGFLQESAEDRRTAACVALTFAAVYAVLVLLVYFSQTTAVRNDALNEQALRILDYNRGGLMFSYDLLGYGMMALSTFFAGLSMKAENRRDRWLKRLLMIHGIFFISCFVMPMTGAFSSMADGTGSAGGIIALECWCAYFIPVGILSALHFSDAE